MFQKYFATFLMVTIMCHCLNSGRAQTGWSNSRETLPGTWQGEGRIIVTWTEQKQLRFQLQINADGAVSGTIGNARIEQGRIRLNNLVYRWLGNARYIIDATLANYLIEKETIRRTSIRIFLNFEKPNLTGGFHTSGSKVGGKEQMILSGTNLKLVKTR